MAQRYTTAKSIDDDRRALGETTPLAGYTQMAESVRLGGRLPGSSAAQRGTPQVRWRAANPRHGSIDLFGGPCVGVRCSQWTSARAFSPFSWADRRHQASTQSSLRSHSRRSTAGSVCGRLALDGCCSDLGGTTCTDVVGIKRGFKRIRMGQTSGCWIPLTVANVSSIHSIAGSILFTSKSDSVNRVFQRCLT